MKSIYKRYFLILLLSFEVLFIGSCKKMLDKTPESQLSDAAFWKTTDDLKKASNYFYSYLPGIYDNVNSNWSDDGFANGGSNSISDGSRQVPATSGDWTNNYKLIFNCNNLLEKSGRVTGDQEIIDRYKGEAKFFRAFAYFRLIKRFGNVPLILHTFDVTDTLSQAHRDSRQIVLDTIYTDLDWAVAHLPKASETSASEYGRITRGAALALKVRIGLYCGTLKKFHQLEDPNQDLQIALHAADTLMASNEYGLFHYDSELDSSYYYLFQYAGEGPSNKENMLVRLYGENESNPISSSNYSGDLGAGNNTTPTRSFMDAFLYKDGLPPSMSAYYKKPTSTLSEFQNRDPRLGMIVFNKTVWYNTAMYTPNFSFSPTGYKVRKYFINQDFINKRSFIDNIIIRYAEVLLDYAEAEFELNGNITDDDLNKTINLLRARVDMPPLTNAFVSANGLDMRTEIRRERRTELGMEGEHRYWDIIRWKTAETELSKPILGIRYFPAEYIDTIPLRLTSDSVVIVQQAAQRNFNPQRDYLWPLPTRDLGLDLHLTQNPNW